MPLSVAQEALWYVSRLAPNRDQLQRDDLDPQGRAVRRRGVPPRLQRDRAPPPGLAHHVRHARRRRGPGRAARRRASRCRCSTLAPRRPCRGRAPRRGLVADVARVPYDLRRGPLLRPRLVRFPGEHHRLVSGDAPHRLRRRQRLPGGAARAGRALRRLLARAGPRRCPSRPPRTPTTRAGSRPGSPSPRVQRRLEYWRRHLEPVASPALPLDRPRRRGALRGGVVPVSLPRRRVDRLRQRRAERRRHPVPGAGLGVGAAARPLRGQRPVVFATAADLRQRPEFEAVVGYCLTPLVLSVDLSGDPSLAELVVRVRNELLDGLDNLVPFERLVRELGPGGDSSANPIYQTMIVLEPPMSPGPVVVDPSDGGRDRRGGRHAKLDLELELDERPEGHISGRLIYDRDLFEARTAARLADHWTRLAAAAAADPGRPSSGYRSLDRRRAAPRAGGVQRHRHRVAAGTVGELVRAHAELRPRRAGGHRGRDGQLRRARAPRNPGRPAAAGRRRGGGRRWSRCPRRLRLCWSPDVLGVLEAGAAYLLLDPELPQRQRDAMVADSGAVTVLDDRPMTSRPTGTLLTASTPRPAA